MSGCGHSIVTWSRSARPGATTYVESPSVTVNGAGTVRITGSPLVSVGPACASASKYGWTLPSRIGGSGPVRSAVTSAISWAATAARRCSTVWMVVSPLPIAVRRSTASTSDSRAGTSGFPDRSTRRNTIPCPAGAGRNVASVRAPVCSPVPETAALFVMLRLVLGAIGPPYERLEIVHNPRQPVQGTLCPQELPVVARRVPRHRGARVDVPDHPALHRDARPAPDRHMVGETGLARQEDVVFDVGAARDPRLTGDQTAGPDATVVADLHEVVDLRPRAHDGVIHAAAIDGRVGADLDVVADDAAPHLRDLARPPPALARHVAETVRPEPHPGVQDDPVSHHGPAVAHHVGQQLHVVPQLDVVPQHARRADPYVPTQPHAATQHRVGADRHGLLPHHAGADHRGAVDARLPDWLRIEHRNDRQQRHVRIAHEHAASGTFRGLLNEIRFAEHDGRARPLKILEIAPGGKKRQVVRTGPVQGRDARHGHVRRAHQLAIRERRDVAGAQAPDGPGSAFPAAFRLWPVAHGLGALFGLLQPLDHLGGDVEARVDRQEHAAVLPVHIEDQRVVGFGADAPDDPDDPGLDRLEQLLLPLLVAGLHVVLALLPARLPGPQVALLRLFPR